MDYSGKFCFIEKRGDFWVVSMYKREGDTATLVEEVSTASKEEAYTVKEGFLK